MVIAIRILSYQRLSRYFGRCCQLYIGSTIASKQQLEQAVRIARMIRLIASKAPWKVTCLAQALLAIVWCRRYNLPYVLFIGLARDKKLSHGVNGHAWLTVGAVAVTGGYAFDTHHVIASYSNMR